MTWINIGNANSWEALGRKKTLKLFTLDIIFFTTIKQKNIFHIENMTAISRVLFQVERIYCHGRVAKTTYQFKKRIETIRKC